MCEICEAKLVFLPEEIKNQITANYEANRDSLTGYKPDALHKHIGLEVADEITDEAERAKLSAEIESISNGLSYIHDLGAALAYLSQDESIYDLAMTMLHTGIQIGDAMRGEERHKADKEASEEA